MDRDYLAADNRFFFEHELAWMLRTRKYEDEMRSACAKSFGSGERTIVSFRGDQEQEHILHLLNSDLRYLRDRDVNYRTISATLPRARKSDLYDTYEVELESGRLTFNIVEYLLVSGKKQLIVNPLQDSIVSTPIATCRVEDCPLARVVLLSVSPAVLIPRLPNLPNP